jgi:hypothetical protein
MSFPTQTVTQTALKRRIVERLRRPMMAHERDIAIAHAEAHGIVVEGVWRIMLGSMRSPDVGKVYFVPREELPR